MKKPVHKINKLQNKKKKAMPKKVALHKPVKAKIKVKTPVKVRVIAKKRVMVLPPKVPAPNKKIATKPISVSSSSSHGQTMFGPVDVKPYQAKKNEEYMSKKQLEHFRMVLLQWKSQLMAEVDRTMHHMQDEASNYPDPVDRASQEEEFSLELRARDRERKLLRKIEETLSRINDNDYGYCDDCGAEIGVRRLEARPTATQCIECKTIAEIREKQVGEAS